MGKHLKLLLQDYLIDRQSGCKRVSIREIIEDYKNTTNSNPRIIIEGDILIKRFYSYASQFKECYEKLLTFLKYFTDLGCELFVFFGGPFKDKKLPEMIQRRKRSAKCFFSLFDSLQNEHIVSTRIKVRDHEIPPHPMLRFLVCNTINMFSGCKVISCVEGKPNINSYALTTNCFAILSENIDHVIKGSVRYFLDSDSLNYKFMTVLCYDRYQIAQLLNLNLEDLPMFATLLGNSVVKQQTLTTFHCKLLGGNKKLKLINEVAKFINENGRNNLSNLSYMLFNTTQKEKLLQKSINSYKVHQDFSDEPKKPSKEKWDEITSFIRENYSTSLNLNRIYDVIIQSRYFCDNYLEDFRQVDVFQPSGSVVQELRRYIYGILLQEKPRNCEEEHTVSEFIMTNFNFSEEKVTPKYLKLKHPGLLNLFNHLDFQESRWNIIREVFHLREDLIKVIPLDLLIPSLSLRYLHQQSFQMEAWEADAVLATNISVKAYSSEELSKLPIPPLTYSSIYLYTVLLRTYSLVTELFKIIGMPISSAFLPHNYTDCKLHYYKYYKSKAGCAKLDLCGSEDNLNIFNELKRVILDGTL